MTAHATPNSPPFNFADSVQRFPTLSHSEVRMVAFDYKAERQFELTCHRDDADDAEVALLRLVRETHPATRLTLDRSGPASPRESPL